MEFLRTKTVVELGKIVGLGLSSLATPFDVLDGANGQQSLNVAMMLRSARASELRSLTQTSETGFTSSFDIAKWLIQVMSSVAL